MNAESRKMQLNGRETFVGFLLAFAPTAFLASVVPHVPPWDMVLDSGRDRGDIICKLVCLCVLTSLGDT